MQHWRDDEVRELLMIRGDERIRNQVTGTVRDTVLYKHIAKILSRRGIVRTPRQVINKLKALKKKYLAITDMRRKTGPGRVHWPFYALCQNVFDSPVQPNPVRLCSPLDSLSPSSSPIRIVVGECKVEVDTEEENGTEPEPTQKGQREAQEAEVEMDGAVRDGAVRDDLRLDGLVRLHSRSSAAVSAAMEELEEMDRVAAEREDVRFRVFSEHERRVWDRQEKMMREDREDQRVLLEQLLSRLPDPAQRTELAPEEPAAETSTVQTNGLHVPPRRRKRTRTELTSTAISTVMAKLEEMDRAAAEREDARFRVFMEHERSLWERQEALAREDRESHRRLFEQLLSRLPEPAHHSRRQPPPSVDHYGLNNYENSFYQDAPSFSDTPGKAPEHGAFSHF
ncbi:uncharacterized protein KZ484_021994 [Pholidichthys leucotaenia]